MYSWRNLITGPSGSLKQERVFYTKEWSKDVNDRFIRALCKQHFAGNNLVEGPNREAILFARHAMNKEYGTTFDYEFCVTRYRKLRKRFHVFHKMVNTTGVLYDPVGYLIRSDQGTWDHFFNEEKLSMAYGFKSELQYPQLWHIFSGEPDEEDLWKEVDRLGNIKLNRVKLPKLEIPDVIAAKEETIMVYENSADSYCYELAWYNEDSESDSDPDKASTSTAVSTNARGGDCGKIFVGERQKRRICIGSGPSSVASNSPFKL